MITRTPQKPSCNPSPARRLLRHLRRNSVAYLALFLALSGSAYAVERGSVGTGQLKKAAVKTGKIADGAVTARKIAGGAVEGSRIAGGAIDTGKIAGGAVDTGKIAAGAVDAARIANGAVTREKLAPGAVTRDQVGLISARADVDDVAATGGTTKDIFRSGPFTIRTRCEARPNGVTYISMFVRSDETATSLALFNAPYYRLDPGVFRPVAPIYTALAGGGTTAFPVNAWTKSGRYLQASVTSTAKTTAASDDCSYLITGFAG